MNNYAIILRNLRARDNCARKRFIMTVHDPRDIPVTQINTSKEGPVSLPECHRHITTLLALAGKLNGSCTTPESLKTFLVDNPNVVTMATELLTSTDPNPAGRNFFQLFPQQGIDDYLDFNNHTLPGAEPRVCGPSSTHMVEIAYDSALCNSAARRDYIQKMLIPQAAQRVATALHEVITKDELQKLLPGHLAQLSKLTERLSQRLSFNGSPCFPGSMPEGAIKPPYATD